ncbi:hypothetical protein KY495_18060 [Massilia sp. PAMC28688]|uniref:GNAT family N-acetyltransferase n=1 Tax=Massilia sp. PAMC28688 TaxID=2861283 RepID=UPI001C6335AB|nr:hypothetical protein [Massilia sp. PAMC28688]QYF92626.1 hypothetical protein KY495_18060 [Massilia sp. PAMC28688]
MLAMSAAARLAPEEGYHFRAADAADAAALLAAGSPGPNHALILAYRHPSLAVLFQEAGSSQAPYGLHVCVDSDGRIAGWACRYRFNGRVGYAGSAQIVIDQDEDRFSVLVAQGLYARLEEDCLSAGVHTVVSTVHASMSNALAWHRGAGFSPCGNIVLGDQQRLYLFSRSIA